jgi:hypothetical protein
MAFPFDYSRPKLLSHKSRSQVIQTNFTDPESKRPSTCVLKFFIPRDYIQYEKEVSAYSTVGDAGVNPQPLADKLWTGSWTVAQYQKFIGNFPSILRKSDKLIHVLMISFIKDAQQLSSITSISRQKQAVRAVMGSLRLLHNLGIAHGDVADSNVLLQSLEDSYSATWVDFSASVTKAPDAMLEAEWRKAVDYFSQLVTY